MELVARKEALFVGCMYDLGDFCRRESRHWMCLCDPWMVQSKGLLDMTMQSRKPDSRLKKTLCSRECLLGSCSCSQGQEIHIYAGLHCCRVKSQPIWCQVLGEHTAPEPRLHSIQKPCPVHVSSIALIQRQHKINLGLQLQSKNRKVWQHNLRI